jgi:hypothetical protein
MPTLLTCNFATGTWPSRKIMQRCEQGVVCRVIVGEDAPDCLWELKYRHVTSEFRQRQVAAFEKLFVEVLRLASASGRVADTGLLQRRQHAIRSLPEPDPVHPHAATEIRSRVAPQLGLHPTH